MHLTVGAFGNTEFVKKLAKAGTTNDIAIYNHGSSEGVLSFVHQSSDKIHTLLQVIGMTELPVIWLSQLTPQVGEQIVAIDAAGFTQGIIVAAGVQEEQIKQLIKGSRLESFPIIPDDVSELRQRILHAEIPRAGTEPWIPIDNYFEVKGAGTVALAVVGAGRIKKYDTLRLEPLGREVMIKSMQSQDKEVQEAGTGMRLGVNIKGAEASELKRGFVLCREATVSANVIATFEKSRYSKEVPEKGGQLFVAAGLQVIAATITDIQNGKLSLKLEHPLAYKKGQKCIFASTKQTLPRILGSGLLK